MKYSFCYTIKKVIKTDEKSNKTFDPGIQVEKVKA